VRKLVVPQAIQPADGWVGRALTLPQPPPAFSRQISQAFRDSRSALWLPQNTQPEPERFLQLLQTKMTDIERTLHFGLSPASFFFVGINLLLLLR